MGVVTASHIALQHCATSSGRSMRAAPKQPAPATRSLGQPASMAQKKCGSEVKRAAGKLALQWQSMSAQLTSKRVAKHQGWEAVGATGAHPSCLSLGCAPQLMLISS